MADNNTLLAKVLGLKDKYESLQNQLADPEVISEEICAAQQGI